VASSSTGQNPRPFAILRNRDFFCYVLGRLMASFGQQMLMVAVGWEIYERTHSSLALGLIGLTIYVPQVAMTLPAGHVADTRERRRVIIFMQAVLALTSFGLALVSWERMAVIWIYVCLFAIGVARTFLWSASASFLPQLVTREEFPLAVNWNSSTYQCAAVTGPAIGGALIALTHSAATVYLANGVTALFCVLMIWLVRARQKIAVAQEVSLDSLLGGFRFVFDHRVILGTITLDLFAVLFGGATALLPVYAKDILKVGPQGLGLLTAALPVGSLVCAVIMAHRPPLKKAGITLIVAVVIFGLATMAFGWSRMFWFSILMLFICGYADNISVIVRHTLVQLLTPDEMRGRVSAVNNLFISTSNELGGFESGVVSQFFGPVFSVVSGGVATVLVVLIVAWVWPEIPRFGRLVQPEPPPAKPDPAGIPQK
jgi:MFS family permease